MALRRIPAFLTLPGPGEATFQIRIQMVKNSVLEAADTLADFDSDTRTIRLPRGAKRDKRIYLFLHEMGHALRDYEHFLAQELSEKRAE